jgi:hypothetical protein
MTSTVDYSYTYVGASTIAGAGYIGAERYLGNDGRCLTAGERDELLASGVGIGLIWETAADRSLDGYRAGLNDAAAANDYADGLDAPVISIWYATDFHAQPDQIEGPISEYYRGAFEFGGRPVRVYGGAPVIDYMAWYLGLGSGWQAAAASWSNYGLSPNACLLQEVEQIWNGAADTNVVLCPDDEIDWLWGRSGGDWFAMATEADLRRVCDDSINAALTKFYTGSRLLRLPPDNRVFELVWRDGVRYRRHVTTNEEGRALQWVDAVAGGAGEPARDITDPTHAAAIGAIPWLDETTTQ